MPTNPTAGCAIPAFDVCLWQPRIATRAIGLTGFYSKRGEHPTKPGMVPHFRDVHSLPVQEWTDTEVELLWQHCVVALRASQQPGWVPPAVAPAPMPAPATPAVMPAAQLLAGAMPVGQLLPAPAPAPATPERGASGQLITDALCWVRVQPRGKDADGNPYAPRQCGHNARAADAAGLCGLHGRAAAKGAVLKRYDAAIDASISKLASEGDIVAHFDVVYGYVNGTATADAPARASAAMVRDYLAVIADSLRGSVDTAAVLAGSVSAPTLGTPATPATPAVPATTVVPARPAGQLLGQGQTLPL
jgi:hypothetical protein